MSRCNTDLALGFINGAGTALSRSLLFCANHHVSPRLIQSTMYRKRSGSLGFSFTRFANAAVPSFFSDESVSRTTDLEGYRRDMCYMHQLASGNPYALDERCFYVAGIVDSEGMSKKTHKALRKSGGLREDWTIDTHQIGPRFTHQMAVLSVNRQRELINLLFWWEEETQRLRKLAEEERELNAMIEQDEGRDREMMDQLKFARERVRMKRRQRPSQRRPDVEADQDDIVMASFQGRSKSAPDTVMHTSGETTGPPPEYFSPGQRVL